MFNWFPSVEANKALWRLMSTVLTQLCAHCSGLGALRTDQLHPANTW